MWKDVLHSLHQAYPNESDDSKSEDQKRIEQQPVECCVHELFQEIPGLNNCSNSRA